MIINYINKIQISILKKNIKFKSRYNLANLNVILVMYYLCNNSNKFSNNKTKSFINKTCVFILRLKKKEKNKNLIRCDVFINSFI